MRIGRLELLVSGQVLFQRFLRGEPVTAGWAFEPARDGAGPSEDLVLVGRIRFAGCVDLVHGLHLLSSQWLIPTPPATVKREFAPADASPKVACPLPLQLCSCRPFQGREPRRHSWDHIWP